MPPSIGGARCRKLWHESLGPPPFEPGHGPRRLGLTGRAREHLAILAVGLDRLAHLLLRSRQRQARLEIVRRLGLHDVPLIDGLEILLALPQPIGQPAAIARRVRLERDSGPVVLERLVERARPFPRPSDPEARLAVLRI